MGAQCVTASGTTALSPSLRVPNLPYTASVGLALRTQVEGSTIRIKTWVFETPEPAWQYTVTDPAPLMQAGSVGIRTSGYFESLHSDVFVPLMQTGSVGGRTAQPAASSPPLHVVIDDLRVSSIAARLAREQADLIPEWVYEGDSPTYVWSEDGWIEVPD
jgi:hypothetical protein